MLTEWEERVLDVMCERRYAYPGEVAEDAEVSREERQRYYRLNYREKARINRQKRRNKKAPTST